MGGTTDERVLAPVGGLVLDLSQVPDPAFSSGMLGPGVGILPRSGRVVSPVDGIVSATVGSGHAVAITTDAGTEVLVHVGIDTASLCGRGFMLHVRQGCRVTVGDRLVSFDRALVEERGLDDSVLITVANAEGAEVTVLAAESVAAGSPILLVRR